MYSQLLRSSESAYSFLILFLILALLLGDDVEAVNDALGLS